MAGVDYHVNEPEFMGYLYKNMRRFGLDGLGQIDAWAEKADGYHFYELKSLEPYSPPPFWGHGLRVAQAEKYLRMEAALGVIWHLVILDVVSNVGYEQLLSVLDGGRRYDTRGGLRVYPLESYNVWTDNWHEQLQAGK